MKATIRLMNEGEVSGPMETIEAPADRQRQEEAARAWADGQIGHPWDLLTVETEVDEYEIELN